MWDYNCESIKEYVSKYSFLIPGDWEYKILISFVGFESVIQLACVTLIKDLVLSGLLLLH